jgi:hypothetical protein
MSTQELDIQAWLERAADEHMRTKVGSALADPLAAKLPQQVLKTEVTVVVTTDGMIEVVEFIAIDRDSREFKITRSVDVSDQDD